MTLKAELLQFLSRMPNTGTVGERKAFLTLVGFDYLSKRINYEGINPVFFNGLLELLGSEGRRTLVTFLENIVASEWVGLEDRNRLNEFIKRIRDGESLDGTSSSAGEPPRQETSQSDGELLRILGQLISADFNQLLWELEVPRGVMPHVTAPASERAFALVEWADGPTGCGLSRVREALQTLLPR